MTGAPLTTELRRPRNRSAACGAWSYGRDEHGTDRHAHDHCTGRVLLPPPNDTCSCWCHGHEDGEPFDGTADEWELYAEAHREWRAELALGRTVTFAAWLVESTEENDR